MIIVIGEARFGAGEIERLRGQLNAWIAKVRARDGCLSYSYAVDLDDPDLLHVVETWRDMDSIDRHMTDMGGLMQALAGADMRALSVKSYEGTFQKTLMGG